MSVEVMTCYSGKKEKARVATALYIIGYTIKTKISRYT